MKQEVHVELDTEQLREQEAHLEHGGMLLPVAGDIPEPMTEVLVRIRTERGRAEFTAQVVHVAGGQMGIAIGDVDTARTRLQPLLADGPAPAPALQNLQQRISRMSSLEKQELALTGDRPERMAILRDSNKALHTALLKNRRISSDEIRRIAGYRNANPDALAKIAVHRDWTRDPRIISALLSNPKTPSHIAVRLLDRVARTELRRLAKGMDVPPLIAKAAKRKLT